jgi:hypothetical protein
VAKSSLDSNAAAGSGNDPPPTVQIDNDAIAAPG